MFSEEPAKNERCKVLYISQLKALAVDVECNLRAPLAGIAAVAARREVSYVYQTRDVSIGNDVRNQSEKSGVGFDKIDSAAGGDAIIWHGRRVCYARKPNCGGCVLEDICPKYDVKEK